MTPAEEALLDRLAADNANLRQIIDHQVERNMRLRDALRDFIRAVDWCLENDPDRMSEIVFDAAVKARSALEGKSDD